MSDVLLILGLGCVVAGAFLLAFVAGMIVLGAALSLLSLALSDGKGVPWRS